MQGFVPHLYQKLLNNTVKIFSFIEFFMPAIEIFLRRNFLLHFQHFLFQPILALQEGKSNSFWTRLRREGSEGSEGSKGSEGKVLKMDGPSAQGFLSLTGPLAPRVVVAASPQFLKKGRGWRRGLCRRVVFASAQGATSAPPLRVADCPWTHLRCEGS